MLKMMWFVPVTLSVPLGLTCRAYVNYRGFTRGPSEAHRANRVTMAALALSSAARRG
jgi:hypothetical protein